MHITCSHAYSNSPLSTHHGIFSRVNDLPYAIHDPVGREDNSALHAMSRLLQTAGVGDTSGRLVSTCNCGGQCLGLRKDVM